MVQVSTAYLASSRVRARSYTTSEPVIRGCTIRRWPLDNRNTACFARRITSSMVLPRRVRSSRGFDTRRNTRSEEHTSELQSQSNLVCRLLLEKKKKNMTAYIR